MPEVNIVDHIKGDEGQKCHLGAFFGDGVHFYTHFVSFIYTSSLMSSCCKNNIFFLKLFYP